MADIGTLVTIADRVFQLLQSPMLKNMKDWESDLENLKKSVSFIKNMLLDADMKPELSHGEQAWVEELKDVLYDADDLFDEIITIAKQKELNAGAKFSKKVLDKATLERNDETCSFLDETHENIIGRDEDVNAIIDMLLDPNIEENVGFVVVVGIGGLGKTTLARLVYNHARVKSKFDKNLWACVSDHDGKGLDVKAILGDIIESSTNVKPSAASTMQFMQTKLQELKNKIYLLILDDVWTEDPNEWSKLRRYLTIGGKGSRVLITTRSEKTAELVLGKATHSKKYMLKGLSDEYAWRLFVLTAFERESDEANDPDLIMFGKKIVKKCSNVPLAIRVLGTLLYGQTHRWESFEKSPLPQIESTKNPIMSILKLSYNNLAPSVKNCFKYCALFPKDFKMNKQELISLWMAQGYIGDSEDCFLILLKRCFFQDVEKYKLGDVVSFKMHDLLHDLAQEVVKDEIIVANCPPNNLSRKTRHLFIPKGEWTKNYFCDTKIRSCYMDAGANLDIMKNLVANWRCLRSLHLYVPDSEYLSESIGDLLHLRCLDLSDNKNLKALPNSIVNLYNLQSLILRNCQSLKGWPKYFCKLVNLRVLDIRKCYCFYYMPLGIDRLISMCDLTNFHVGSVSSVARQFSGQLEDLKSLVNLRGALDIEIGVNLESEKENVCEEGYLEHLKNLKAVGIHFRGGVSETNYEALIAKLQPSRNLMQLFLFGYSGTEIPRWGRLEHDWSVILPNLVRITVGCCERLHGIPLLRNLKHLRFLFLYQLQNLEYMEPGAINRGSSGEKDLPFFLSLEHLEFWDLKKLKGWWGGVVEGDSSSSSSAMLHLQPPFPCLLTLIINSFAKLTSLPPCPSLESLDLKYSNVSLRLLPGDGPPNLDFKIRVVDMDNVGYATTDQAARCLTHIKIDTDHELKRLSETEKIFKSSSSLRSLTIHGCMFTSVSGAFEHLTALESLSLIHIPIHAEVVHHDIFWSSMRHRLRSLKLSHCDTLQFLPTGMKHLTALQNLFIWDCKSLKGLPEWISCLSSLRSLMIRSCPDLDSLGTIQCISSLQELDIRKCPVLKEACEEPRGKDWPKIRHIPHISITDW